MAQIINNSPNQQALQARLAAQFDPNRYSNAVGTQTATNAANKNLSMALDALVQEGKVKKYDMGGAGLHNEIIWNNNVDPTVQGTGKTTTPTTTTTDVPSETTEPPATTTPPVITPPAIPPSIAKPEVDPRTLGYDVEETETEVVEERDQDYAFKRKVKDSKGNFVSDKTGKTYKPVYSPNAPKPKKTKSYSATFRQDNVTMLSDKVQDMLGKRSTTETKTKSKEETAAMREKLNKGGYNERTKTKVDPLVQKKKEKR
jgi:hypothetical protein